MRRSLLLIPVAPAILAGAFFGGQASAPQAPVQTKVVTHTITRTVTAPAPTPAPDVQPPVYRIGDTQGGVTLLGKYQSSYQDSMGAAPRTIEVVVFSLSGISQSQARHAVLLLSDGTYAPSDTPLVTFTDVPACAQSACVAFSNPGLVIKAFLYNGLEWSL